MNVDNFLGSRPSTRVHAPPGGASSICFGASEPVAPARRRTTAAPAKKLEEPAPKPVAAAPKPVLRETNVPAASAPTGGAKPRVSSNAFANGSNQNCGNFITDRPTTRLHAPPGGKSSFSLGWN